MGIAASFRGLGDLPGGAVWSSAAAISADGSVVVGSSSSGTYIEAFRWTAQTGMVGLGDLPGSIHQSTGNGVSGDGSVIVGSASGEGGTTAFRWTTAGGMVALGVYPEQGGISVHDVSADGSTAVGTGRGFTVGQLPSQALFWSADGEPHPLTGPTDSHESDAHGVSADGSVIVGYVVLTTPARHLEAFRWTADTGMVPLGDLPGGETFSTARDASSDGSVIVGASTSGIGSEAFRWTETEGMRGLGILPGWESSVANAVSDDGSIIVGTLRAGDPRTNPTYSAFIWDESHGMRYLQDMLEDDLGLDLTGWTLTNAAAISATGTTIVGSGRNPAGQGEAWVAVIPEPSSALGCVIAFAGLAMSGRRRGRHAQHRR